MSDFGEEFYNTFYNAFTSEDVPITPKNATKVISESLSYDNVYENHQRPPKLMNIEDYHWWYERFENWVQAYAYDSWICLTLGYNKPRNDRRELITLKDFTADDKKEHSAELRMKTLLQQSIREDIFSLLQYGETSKSIWEALKVKAEGGKDIKKNKISLLKKEFDMFSCMKNETVRQMIERFCHLKIELERFEINKDREEMVDKLVEALPPEDDWKTYVIVLKNDVNFEKLTLDQLIEKIEGHDLLIQKQNKMSSSNYQQNVGLYYRRGLLQNNESSKINESPRIKTGFTAEKTSDTSKNTSSSYDPGYHASSASGSSTANPNSDWKNSPLLNNEFAQQHMSFLASILVSYEGLIAGKIGNPNMTKEDYDQVDPEEMELMDIRWCMASVIRKAQRFMEITGRKCLEGPETKMGFDKNKVTCFKCKEKGHFKRECPNNRADESVNPFREDYYKKAIYHKNTDQPIRKQIDGASSKEKRAALSYCDQNVDSIDDDYKSMVQTLDLKAGLIEAKSPGLIIYDDEGYDWSQHEEEVAEVEVKAMTAEITLTREERHARMRLDDVYNAYREATWAGRWSKDKGCYVDPQGNPTVDPKTVDLDALVAAIPTVDVWCKGIRENPRYKQQVEEGIRKVIFASLEEKKKKTVEEIVTESEKMVNEVKKVEGKAEEVVEEKTQVAEEDQIQKIEEAKVPVIEVIIQTDTSDKIDNEAEQQCKKCMETCSSCIEKDAKLNNRDIEFTKIEKIFKEKCHEMIENEKFLKQENDKLKLKCDNLETENKKLKEKCSAVCNECVPKDIKIQELQKEYDVMKLSYETVKEAYETLKNKVKSLDDRLCACQRNTKFLEARYEDKQRVVNQYIDDVAKLKKELADKEKLVNKLQSYHSSSYILERIFNITPDEKESENKKGIGSEYHQVPPPLENNYTFYDGEQVEKVINMVDQLPDNIDVIYTKPDDLHDSGVVSKVVESVFKEESVAAGKTESQVENDGNFHDEYLKNTTAEKNLNDDSKGLVYTMIGSDKLFLDVVFPIQNVISERIDQVFKMVEIEKSEISKFAGKGHKTFYNKPGVKKKNMKAGLGYKRKQNWKKNVTSDYQEKMSFVQGDSLAKEKELKMRQSNAEFEAMKTKQQLPKDVSKKVCFKCDQIGHVARKCSNPKSVDDKDQTSESGKPRLTRFDSKQTWRFNTNKFSSNQNWKSNLNRFDSKQNSHSSRSTTTQIWKPLVVVTKSRKEWKPKNVVQKQQVQKETNFYKRGVPEGQKWSVKKSVDLMKVEKQKQSWKPKVDTISSTSAVLDDAEDCESVAQEEVEDPWF
ncbi:putative transcription factor interactor and regulator CCHC(Zn) family [Helianthus annuus]|nr:putative transcription factor interactor and regulator CCHC(Zn) family [Helianthus annuus]